MIEERRRVADLTHLEARDLRLREQVLEDLAEQMSNALMAVRRIEQLHELVRREIQYYQRDLLSERGLVIEGQYQFDHDEGVIYAIGQQVVIGRDESVSVN